MSMMPLQWQQFLLCYSSASLFLEMGASRIEAVFEIEKKVSPLTFFACPPIRCVDDVRNLSRGANNDDAHACRRDTHDKLLLNSVLSFLSVKDQEASAKETLNLYRNQVAIYLPLSS